MQKKISDMIRSNVTKLNDFNQCIKYKFLKI